MTRLTYIAAAHLVVAPEVPQTSKIYPALAVVSSPRRKN